MATRRRRFRRRFAGSKGGRRFFWFRDTSAGITLRQSSSATHSDILLDASFWDFQVSALNDAQRGGARLERLICDFGLSVQANADWVRTSGNANIALIPEFMLFTQSDQFATLVNSTTDFDSVRDDQRVLMNEIPMFESSWALSPFTNEQLIRSVRGRYETKVKARLADRAVSVAWRGFFDTGSVNLQGYTDYVRTTFLISVP